MNELEYIDYFEAIAEAHNGIAHTQEAKRFALIEEVWDGLNTEIDPSTLLMVIRNEEADAEEVGSSNLVEKHRCAFWVVKKCEPGAHAETRQAYTEALQTSRDIISKMVADKTEGHSLMAYFDRQSVRYRKEGPIFGNCFGYITEFTLAVKAGCHYRYDETRWTWTG